MLASFVWSMDLAAGGCQIHTPHPRACERPEAVRSQKRAPEELLIRPHDELRINHRCTHLFSKLTHQPANSPCFSSFKYRLAASCTKITSYIWELHLDKSLTHKVYSL